MILTAGPYMKSLELIKQSNMKITLEVGLV